MPAPKQNTTPTLLGNSTYIFLIRVMPALASLFVLITFSRHFEPEFVGFYQNFWVHFQVYSALACLGLPALLLTYPLGKLKEFALAIKWKSVGFVGLWVLILAVLFAYKQFPGHSFIYLFFPFAFLLVSVVNTICEAYLIVARKFAFIAFGTTLYSVFFLCIHALFLAGHLSFSHLLSFLLLGVLSRGLSLTAIATGVFRATPAVGAPSPPLSNMRSLWFHLGVYDIIQTVFRWADKFVLSFFLSRELFAVYMNGTVDIPLLPILLGAVGSALLLHLGERDTSDRERIRLLRTSSSKLALIVFPLFFFFIFFREEVFEVVFKGKYASAVPLFLISSLVIPLRAYNFTSILQFRGKGRIINTGAILDLAIALGLMYPLYLIWQLNGVALAFVISTYIQAGFYLWHTARALRCRVVDLLALQPLLVTFAACALVFFIAHSFLASYFNALHTLILGCVLLAFTLMTVLLQQLLLKRRLNG